MDQEIHPGEKKSDRISSPTAGGTTRRDDYKLLTISGD